MCVYRIVCVCVVVIGLIGNEKLFFLKQMVRDNGFKENQLVVKRLKCTYHGQINFDPFEGE